MYWDYVLINQNLGEPSSNAAWHIGAVSDFDNDGKLDYYSAGGEGQLLRNLGENKFEARFIDVYVKRNGAWQMVAWQSTRLPD